MIHTFLYFLSFASVLSVFFFLFPISTLLFSISFTLSIFLYISFSYISLFLFLDYLYLYIFLNFYPTLFISPSLSLSSSLENTNLFLPMIWCLFIKKNALYCIFMNPLIRSVLDNIFLWILSYILKKISFQKLHIHRVKCSGFASLIIS